MPGSNPRFSAISMPTARSATSSFSTSGVFVTVIPRAVAAATSMASYPTPKLAITRRFGSRSICAAPKGAWPR